MNKSESIGALSLALSKLQGEIQNLHKDKQGYGYKYTELASVLDVARPLCAKYELAVAQLCTNLNEQVGVETVLTHSSGEWISSTLYMSVEAGKGVSLAQSAGKVITYARRYSLAAILGVAQTDNDAAIERAPDVKLLAALNKLIVEKSLEDKIEPWCKFYKISELSELNDAQIKSLIKRIEEAA